MGSRPGFPGDREEQAELSVTLDKSIVEEIRAEFGEQPISTTINSLLHSALDHARLNRLVDNMIDEAGQPSDEAYERVLAQWFAD